MSQNKSIRTKYGKKNKSTGTSKWVLPFNNNNNNVSYVFSTVFPIRELPHHQLILLLFFNVVSPSFFGKQCLFPSID